MSDTDVREILEYLPHRYPFLLVDRITHFEANKRITAIKNVTFNEQFFMGHFPNMPVMPGVLIIEALAQASCLLAVKSKASDLGENDLVLFAGIDKVRFKQVVQPGDVLQLDVEFLREKQMVWKFFGKATVNGQVVCSAELMSAKRTIEKK